MSRIIIRIIEIVVGIVVLFGLLSLWGVNINVESFIHSGIDGLKRVIGTIFG